MKRKEVRKHIFSIIFQIDFADRSELSEKLIMYLDDFGEYAQFITDGAEEEKMNDSEVETELSNKERSFIETEFNGVVSNLEALDAFIVKYAKDWTIERLSKVDLSIMRLAIYEILFADDIPASVSINEAVELAKIYSGDEAPSFINGILGNVVKEQSAQNG